MPEIDVEPGLTARLARWLERGRVIGRKIEAARSSHSSVDLGFEVVERDATIGGGLLAGALAYRLFVLLLPTSLLLVSGVGLYAGAVDKSTAKVTEEAGLHGLIASEVAASAGGRARALVFLLMIPAVLYATITLYRSLARVYMLVWQGSARGARITPKGLGLFIGALLVHFAVLETVGWIRRGDQFGGLAALLIYLVLVGGSWLVVSTQLPHAEAGWSALLPGAAFVGVGLLFVNVFNVYVTTRIVEGRENTYGALGIAAALLFSLVLVGRLLIVSAELNAALYARRSR
jgi:uncharacterized BrkB/YihY/UPF0761 family membrane protein